MENVMSNFTAGPWELDAEDFEVFEKDGGMICTVRHPQDSPCIDVGDEGYVEAATECEANANLIVAAPDIYEALKDAVRWLDGMYQMHQGEALDSMPNNCLPRSAMRAALAKAEGKQ
jgi:hypothetical protein